jgi:hypothetical protein
MTIRSNTPTTPNRGRGRGRSYGVRSSNTSNRNISPSKNPLFIDEYNELDISTMNEYATRIELENLENKVIDSFREMVKAQEQQTIQLNTVAEVVLSVQEKCEALEISTSQERPRSAMSRLEAKISNKDMGMDAKSDLDDMIEVFEGKIRSINDFILKKFEKVDDESSSISGQVLENKKSLDNWKNKCSSNNLFLLIKSL